MRYSSDQYQLDFTSDLRDRLAQVRSLRRVEFGIAPGRAEGVIQLLERLLLICSDVRGDADGRIRIVAQVSKLAAGIEGRSSVSERTIRRWTADARELELLEVVCRSQLYGWRNWNEYFVRLDRVLAALSDGDIKGGHGRTRPDILSAPRPDILSALKTLTISQEHSQLTEAPPREAIEKPARSWGVVVSDLLGLGMSEAARAVSTAQARGMTIEQVDELIRAYHELSSTDARVTVGWLYRWLIGRSSPQKPPQGPPASPKRTTDATTRAELIRSRVIIDGRRVGADQAAMECELRSRLVAAGLEGDLVKI